MLNILKTKQKTYDKVALYSDSQDMNKKKNVENTIKNQYKNNIYYPDSTKEWFNSIYSYNKSYIKSIINFDKMSNNLLKGYFNMIDLKRKVFKRRRPYKMRYSANKIFTSRAELKHTNTKLTIILYIYNKQKISIEEYIKKALTLETPKKQILGEKSKIKKVYKNRLSILLKNKIFYFKEWNNIVLTKTDNLFKCIEFFSRIHKTVGVKKKLIQENIIFNLAKLINFNKFKFSNLLLNFMDLGLISLIRKIYNKDVKIKLVELKSIHLNSDIFSSAVALRLRNRKNKAVKILRKAVIKMVKIPSLHTLITFDDRIEKINKNNILNVIKQQVVSGVRFEASGRLTRRLTAARAVFKIRYVGSLKNIRSSFNRKSSTILRGHVKSNSQYTVIHSKTRNGAFGLKGWVSSH